MSDFTGHAYAGKRSRRGVPGRRGNPTDEPDWSQMWLIQAYSGHYVKHFTQ
jgi:hypothetical protein